MSILSTDIISRIIDYGSGSCLNNTTKCTLHSFMVHKIHDVFVALAFSMMLSHKELFELRSRKTSYVIAPHNLVVN